MVLTLASLGPPGGLVKAESWAPPPGFLHRESGDTRESATLVSSQVKLMPLA